MTPRTALCRPVAVLALVVATLAVCAQASAHAELVSSDPADGATVNELTSVHLEFSEDLLTIGNSVKVTDGAGVEHDATLTFPASNQLDAAVTDVAPGAVTIAWRNASVDGHTEEGELHVTLVAKAGTPSVTPSATPPGPTPSVTLTEAGPAPSPTTTHSVVPISARTFNPLLLVALGVVVIGAIAAAIISATRRRPPEA